MSRPLWPYMKMLPFTGGPPRPQVGKPNGEDVEVLDVSLIQGVTPILGVLPTASLP
jgi:hypothetical protein